MPVKATFTTENLASYWYRTILKEDVYDETDVQYWHSSYIQHTTKCCINGWGMVVINVFPYQCFSNASPSSLKGSLPHSQFHTWSKHSSGIPMGKIGTRKAHFNLAFVSATTEGNQVGCGTQKRMPQ